MLITAFQPGTKLLQVATCVLRGSRMMKMGFEKEIDIGFFTPKDGSTRYPTASTCGLQLQLPRGIVDTDEFVNIMAEGILNALGFGKV